MAFLVGGVDKAAGFLRKPPAEGWSGWWMEIFMKRNALLETSAVDLLEIEPDHNVLEVGFGHGYGLEHLLNSEFGANGNGKLYGVDFSTPMCDRAKKIFPDYISTDKLEILNEDVQKMTLRDSNFDKVFHTHSHIYWPDLSAACSELFRVMRPKSTMVTVMDPYMLGVGQRKGYLKYSTNLTPEEYIGTVEQCGFVNIEKRDIKLKSKTREDLLAILCRKP